LFDPEGSTGTSPYAISSNGEIVGSFKDVSSTHGFLRKKNGAITSFDVPGSVGTFAGSVNAVGQIAGSYDVATQSRTDIGNSPDLAICFIVGPPVSAFLRQKDGTITTFTAPDTLVTGTVGLDRVGNVAGLYLDGNCTSHGFLRKAQ